MKVPKAKLIAKYLAGDADDREVQELVQLFVEDPLAADAVISEAYMDVQIRETLGRSTLGAAITQIRPPHSANVRFLANRWMAVLLLQTICSWTTALPQMIEPFS